MRKILTAILALAMLLSLAACGDKPKDTSDTTTKGSNLSGTLEEIIDRIYKNAAENSYSTYYASGDAMYFIDITADKQEHFYGCTFEYEEAVASEFMMTPPAYSLSVIRLKDGADVNAVMTKLRDNINPMRWVCVGVEKVLVVNVGNIIGVFMMTNEGATALSDSFLALAGK
jgi:hypothetical protein